MGNITNLATTGNYDFEQNGLKVNFSFTIDKENDNPTRIENGSVSDTDATIATFETPRFFVGNQRLKISSDRGREMEATTVILAALAQFEQEVKGNV